MRIPVMNSARTSRNFVLLNIDSNRKMFNPKTTKILPLSGWNRNIAANEWIRNRVKNYIDIAIALKETKTSSRSVAIIGVDMADNVFNKIYEFNLTKKDSNKLAIKVTNSAIDDRSEEHTSELQSR